MRAYHQGTKEIYKCVPAQSRPILLLPYGPGSSVHGISQSRILEWVAMPSSRGSFWPRDWTCISCVSCIRRQILYHWATWEARRNVHVRYITGREKMQHQGPRCKKVRGTRLRNRKATLMKHRLLSTPIMRLIYITKNTGLNSWDVTFPNSLLVDTKLRCWRFYGKSTISRLKNQPWAVENLICNFMCPEIKCILQVMKTIHPIEEIAMNCSSLKVVTINTFLVILIPWCPWRQQGVGLVHTCVPDPVSKVSAGEIFVN